MLTRYAFCSRRQAGTRQGDLIQLDKSRHLQGATGTFPERCFLVCFFSECLRVHTTRPAFFFFFFFLLPPFLQSSPSQFSYLIDSFHGTESSLPLSHPRKDSPRGSCSQWGHQPLVKANLSSLTDEPPATSPLMWAPASADTQLWRKASGIVWLPFERERGSEREKAE